MNTFSSCNILQVRILSSCKNSKKVHPDDFDKWAEIIQAENDIMNSFFAVCDILKKYDVVLEQFRVTVKGVSTTTYSDFMESFHEKHRN